ncbi:MAG: cupredoxin domain-containing protein [Actinomycetota bacterium]
MPIPRRRISTIFVVVLTALSLGACGDTSAPAADTSASDETSPADAASSDDGTQVILKKFAFDPDPVSVSVGDTVTWTNEDDILHTVTSGKAQEQGVPGVTEDTDSAPDGLFDQPLEFGDEFSFTFEEAGEITYFCNIHPGMTGSIVVK